MIYTLDLLNETRKLGCRPASTPLEQNWKQKVKENDSTVDKERYQRIVGKLIYISLIRPDITYSARVVSQFKHSATQRHLETVNQILRYLKGPLEKGFCFKRMIIGELNVLQMQIGQVQLRIASPQLTTALNYGVTWSLGGVKSKQL